MGYLCYFVMDRWLIISMIKQTKQNKSFRDKAQMLLLIVMTLSTIVFESQRVLCATESLIDRSNNQSLRYFKSGQSLNQIIKTNKTITKSHEQKDAFGRKPPSNQRDKLEGMIIFEHRIPTPQVNKTTDDWIRRHNYNYSEPINAQTNRTSVESAVILLARSAAKRKPVNSSDPLDVSDSRLVPQRISTRSDDGQALSSTSNQDDPIDDLSYGYSDAASSNLIEKKVVKELTKILSKGMSGATDQLRLETLENLKRRQRERKLVKETRAKAFEEILTTAINSHPEKVAKKGTKSAGSMKYSASSSPWKKSHQSSTLGSMGLGQNPDIDPELSADAETVLQHLQGLSSALDSSSSLASGSSNAGGDSLSSADPASPEDASYDSSDQSSYGGTESSNGDANESSWAGDDKPMKSKPSDRPLVRQFKKIKQQISQRRKQLDHIKKLFNVELSINPKDGSLMGKPASSSGKRRPSSDEQSESEEPADSSRSYSTGSKRRAQSQGSTKLKDLMTYLKENPEILASVMSELTVGADPRLNNRQVSLPLSSHEEGPYQAPATVAELNDQLDFATMSNRSSSAGPGYFSHRGRQHISGPLEIAEPEGPQSWSSERVRHRHSRSNGMGYASDLESHYRSFDNRARSTKTRATFVNLAGQPTRATAAEALLLESLRERQLLNLARLEAVLAERSPQSTSNHSLTSLNSMLPLRRLQQEYTRPEGPLRVHQNFNSADDSIKRTSGNDSGSLSTGHNESNGDTRNFHQRSEGEIAHHFMVVGPQHSLNGSQGFADHSWNGSYPLNQATNGIANSSLDQSDHQNRTSQMIQNLFRTYGPSEQQHSTQQQNNSRQPQQPLRRFRDWRDVSQSEASSWQTDKAPFQNYTWLPYDLSTGSSASAGSLQSNNQYSGSNSINYESSIPQKRTSVNLGVQQPQSFYGNQASATGLTQQYNSNNQQNETGTSGLGAPLATNSTIATTNQAAMTAPPPYQIGVNYQSSPPVDVQKQDAPFKQPLNVNLPNTASNLKDDSDMVTIKLNNMQSEQEANYDDRQQASSNKYVRPNGRVSIDATNDSKGPSESSMPKPRPSAVRANVFEPQTVADYLGQYRQNSDTYRVKKKDRPMDGDLSRSKRMRMKKQGEMLDDEEDRSTDELSAANSVESGPADDNMGAMW